MKHIPNFITSLNLASGFVAVIFAANGDLMTASWLILAAMVFDFFDGFLARMLKAYSEMGKELDSLADIVSFGVAPAMILYKLLLLANQNIDSQVSGFAEFLAGIIIYVPALMPVCAALRLAKFNLDMSQSASFRGLPTPANAIAVISVIFAKDFSSVPLVESFTGSVLAIVIYTVILSSLMVTNIRLLSNKMTSLKFTGNEGRYILIGLVLISFAIFGFASTPLIIPFYILASFIELIFVKRAKNELT